MTDDGCSTNTYDGFDRLSRTVGSGTSGCTAVTIAYTYDARDRQTARTESGSGAVNPGVTTIGHDGLDAATSSETLPNGSTTRYTLGPITTGDSSSAGQPLAVSTTTGTTQYLADDGHGNIATTTTTVGGLACSLRYDPWGSPIDVAAGIAIGQSCTNSGGSTPSDILYRSQRKDSSTGTYQLGTRTYDPSKAAFLTPDVYRNGPSNSDLAVGTDPLTRDSYSYVNGDPVNLNDPTGHDPCGAPGGGGGGCPSNDLSQFFMDLFRHHPPATSGPRAFKLAPEPGLHGSIKLRSKTKTDSGRPLSGALDYPGVHTTTAQVLPPDPNGGVLKIDLFIPTENVPGSLGIGEGDGRGFDPCAGLHAQPCPDLH